MFEGAPVLLDPLAQNIEARRPEVTEGDWLDTLTACPPLGIVENAKAQELRSKAKHELAGKSAEAREKFIGRQAEALPSIVLPFDDPELAGKTVADVLADPRSFEGETLADPLEGIEYGVCKAKIMRRADGTLWINSFAHGRTTYELKHDAAAVHAAMAAADVGEVVSVLVEKLMQAAVEPSEEEALIAYAKERTRQRHPRHQAPDQARARGRGRGAGQGRPGAALGGTR